MGRAHRPGAGTSNVMCSTTPKASGPAAPPRSPPSSTQMRELFTMACRHLGPANGSLLEQIPSPKCLSQRQQEPTGNQRQHGQRRSSSALRLLTVRVTARVGGM
mmetsp:Transcript_164468/g.522899  ORF Transcript_164468/g.522899 Transcript_164468/m.522899 type:complete len:104 (+) Transcript_164468:1326-1637(+)